MSNLPQIKTFAKDYPKNEKGEIVFPNDNKRRRESMPFKVDHPSHNSIYLYEEVIEYLSEPGQVVCDPMAGAGTILLACPLNRRLYLIELGPYFVGKLRQNRDALRGIHLSVKDGAPPTDLLTVIKEGDCVEELPKIESEMASKAQLIVFSPPYANQVQTGKGHAIHDTREGGEDEAGIGNYNYKHPRNLARMKEFQFNRMMQQVYKACYEANLVGGFLCVIIKDRIDGGKLVGYGTHHARMALKAGYQMFEWHKREAVGQLFGRYNLNQGYRQVQNEHIIIMRKV